MGVEGHASVDCDLQLLGVSPSTRLAVSDQLYFRSPASAEPVVVVHMDQTMRPIAETICLATVKYGSFSFVVFSLRMND